MILFITVSCAKKDEEKDVDLSSGTLNGIEFTETREITNFVKIEMDDNSLILIELFPDIAPISVENFQNLVKDKFYDELVFHRVIEGFMIQTGQSNKETATIKGEFRRNGIDNELEHHRGVVSMARQGDENSGFDTASTQFFIVHQNASWLDEKYAAFGEMIAGFETLDSIATVETGPNDRPINPPTIRNIRFIEIN